MTHLRGPRGIRRSQSLNELKNGFHDVTLRGFQDVARTASNSKLDSARVDKTPERKRAGTLFTPNKELPPTPSGERKRGETQVDSPRTKKNVVNAWRKLVPLKKENIEIESPGSPRLPNKRQMKPSIKDQKIEKIPQEIKEIPQECERNLQSLSGLVSIMHGYSSREELTLSFPLAHSISNLNSILKDLERKEILNFYNILFLPNPDLLDDLPHTKLLGDLPHNQEKKIEEFTRKIIEFIDKIEKLREGLEENGVLIMKESSKTRSDTSDLIKAIRVFNEKHGKMFQNQLSNFHIALKTDEESSNNVFEEIRKFFKSLKSLTETFIKCFGFNGYTVIQKGNPFRIKLDEDRYGQSEPRDATDFLISIPREISQYEDLLSKHLIKNAQVIAAFVEEKRLPFPSVKNASNFVELLILLKKLHGKIMAHDSLYAPLNLYKP